MMIPHYLHLNKMYVGFNILLYILFITAVLTSPFVTGYEISALGAYPPIAWVFFFFSLFLNIIYIFRTWNLKSSLKYFIYVVMILEFCFILFLPLIRGYLFAFDADWDTLYHLGEAKYIINHGYLDPNDWYPALHIILFCISLLGLPDNFLLVILSSISSLLFIVYILIFSKTMFKRDAILYILLFSFPFLVHHYHRVLMPSWFSLLILPLLFYSVNRCVLSKNMKSSHYIILFVLSVSVVFFHPLTAMIALFYLIGFMVYGIMSRKICYVNKIFFLTCFICSALVIWLLYQSNFSSLLNNEYYRWFDILFEHGSLESSVLQERIDTLYNSEADFYLITQRIFGNYGNFLIYCILGTISCFEIFCRMFRTNHQDFELLFLIEFIIGNFLTAILLFSHAVQELLRAAQFLVLLLPILCGLLCYNISIYVSRSSLKRICHASVLLLICVCTVSGIVSIYPNSINGLPNIMITYQDADVAEWFICNGNEQTPIISPFLPLRTYGYYHDGRGYNSFRYNTVPTAVPSHFGYSINNPGDYIICDKYTFLITNDKMRLYQLSVPEYRRTRLPQYNENDFYILNQDIHYIKIYTTAGDSIYVINYH